MHERRSKFTCWKSYIGEAGLGDNDIGDLGDNFGTLDIRSMSGECLDGEDSDGRCIK